MQSGLIEEDVYCERCEMHSADLMEVATISLAGVEEAGQATYCYECEYIDAPKKGINPCGGYYFLGHRVPGTLDDADDEESL